MFGAAALDETGRQLLADGRPLAELGRYFRLPAAGYIGMAQDVGPILEIVTEKYLLRSEAEWVGRQQAIGILDTVLDQLRAGDIRAIVSASCSASCSRSPRPARRLPRCCRP